MFLYAFSLQKQMTFTNMYLVLHRLGKYKLGRSLRSSFLVVSFLWIADGNYRLDNFVANIMWFHNACIPSHSSGT